MPQKQVQTTPVNYVHQKSQHQPLNASQTTKPVQQQSQLLQQQHLLKTTKQNGQLNSKNVEVTSAEDNVEVTETVVLPKLKKKENRLDFTKKWLVGDIKSWSSDSQHQIKPDLLLDSEQVCFFLFTVFKFLGYVLKIILIK